MPATTTNEFVVRRCKTLLRQIETHLGADVLYINSPILSGLDVLVNEALSKNTKGRRNDLFIVLTTGGGVVEVVERMVNTIRHFYSGEVSFIVPDRAMSAGTIFVMSGDHIFMNHFSVLGPIDPQVERDGKLVPALSYLSQLDELRARATKGQLTQADAILLSKLDLAELHRFQQAKELSISLLRNWLANYKFKNWNETETRKIPVSYQDKEKRAEEIATILSDHEQWFTHGRGIGIKALQEKVGLKVGSFDNDPTLSKLIAEYYGLLSDHCIKNGLSTFVHTRGFI